MRFKRKWQQQQVFIQLLQLFIFKCHCLCNLEECLCLVYHLALCHYALNRNALS